MIGRPSLNQVMIGPKNQRTSHQLVIWLTWNSPDWVRIANHCDPVEACTTSSTDFFSVEIVGFSCCSLWICCSAVWRVLADVGIPVFIPLRPEVPFVCDVEVVIPLWDRSNVRYIPVVSVNTSMACTSGCYIISSVQISVNSVMAYIFSWSERPLSNCLLNTVANEQDRYTIRTSDHSE